MSAKRRRNFRKGHVGQTTPLFINLASDALPPSITSRRIHTNAMPPQFVSQTSRAFVKISGADAADFLQRLVTQDVFGMKAGEARYAALLTPQGKVLFDFFILKRAEDFILDTEATQARALAKRLSIYKLRADVAIEDVSDHLAAAQFLGEGVEAPGRAVEGFAFVDPRLAALGIRMIAPPGAIADAAAACGADEADEADYLQRRIALGVPEGPGDIRPEQTFPLDANMDALRGVDFQKGCFVGQEVTSRAKRRGEIRKRTLIARYHGAAPAYGTPVTAGDSTLGETLSGAGAQGLAVIRLDRLAAARERGDAVQAGGVSLEFSAPEYLNLEL